MTVTLFEVMEGRGNAWRLDLGEYNGRPVVNWRCWWRKDGEGEWLPSKKGVAFSPEKLDELAEALEALRAERPPSDRQPG